MAPELADGTRRVPALSLLRRWQRADEGTTAIEFAMVAMPFLLLLFGIMSVSLFYFANFSLENAVWQAARAIRTGQMQQSTGSYTGLVTLEEKRQAFKKVMCERAVTFPDCKTKAVVILQSNASFGGISEPSCTNQGTMVDQSSAPFDAGGASAVVLVTVCYPWDFGGKLPFFKLGTLKDGSLLMQASAAFRTEPYN